jgi:3-dehydroquinate synthase II
MYEKELIIDLRDFDKELVTSTIEEGVKKIIIPKGRGEQVHKLGRIETIAPDGDLILGKDLIEHEIKSKSDEDKALIDSKKSLVLIHANDWKIIPLENLVSKSNNILVSCTVSEIPTMLTVLEKGVRGVVVKPKNRQDIIDAVKELNKSLSKIDLVEAIVTNIKILGSGERACVDTCNLMDLGEGMLIGNSPKMLFLVQSESMEVEYCATRPFRVNAGSIHSYVLLPEGKTKYLLELNSGDEALCVNSKGETKKVIVGRNKIENRPLVLIEAKMGEQIGAVILQNAETIRVITQGGKSISVAQLKTGDKILVKLGEAGRHFGQAIKEKILE